MPKCVDHHKCEEMPQSDSWEIYRVENENEGRFVFRIGNLIAILIDYCPYCGERLEGVSAGE
ncbi:hypothetical protein [Sporomusa malonica]|uniref:Uncharacterized protein n=1 Tax=Sporomusa malonica TaxID=112901 RepID=A0A1W2AT43_9FIRM|nr:hypothetical protein [Sporomusa malonica]SMC63764.1 hypothetical protein SAMN04488500_10688 [Sporomusa malonica]